MTDDEAKFDVRVRERLEPVRKGERGVGALGGLKGFRRLLVMEAVQERDPAEERRMETVPASTRTS